MAAAGVSKEKTVRFSNYIMQEETQSLLVRKIEAGENRVRSEQQQLIHNKVGPIRTQQVGNNQFLHLAGAYMRQSRMIVNESFLLPQDNIETTSLPKFKLMQSVKIDTQSTGGHLDNELFRIFNLSDLTYRDASIKDVKALLKVIRSSPKSSDFLQQQYIILTYSMTEEMMQSLMQILALNPILFQEVNSRQTFDKLLPVSPSTSYFNLLVHQEYSHKDTVHVKMIQSEQNRILLILTDQKHPSISHATDFNHNLFSVLSTLEGGFDLLSKLLKKSFFFESQDGDTSPIESTSNLSKSPKMSMLQQLRESVDPFEPERDQIADSAMSQNGQEEEDFGDDDDEESQKFLGISQKSRSRSRDEASSRFRINYEETPLTREDVLIAVIQEALRRIEQVITGFEKEAQALNSLSHNLSHVEKMDFARRSYEAKQAMIAFNLELKSKDRFFTYILAQDETTPKTTLMIRILQGRLYNCQLMMERSTESIKLSDQVYQYAVDNALNQQSVNLNHVMKALTVITVMFIPFTVISGLMGMNVMVPFFVDLSSSLAPFFTVIGICLATSLSILCIFKRLKWL